MIRDQEITQLKEMNSDELRFAFLLVINGETSESAIKKAKEIYKETIKEGKTLERGEEK